MSDQKLSALTAETTIAPNDLVMAVDVSDTTMAATGTNKKVTRESLQTYNAGTLTTDKKVLDLSATWDNAAVTFTGVKFNATDTASASGSLLMDLQVGGATRLHVTKAGRLKPADYGAADDTDLLFFRGTFASMRVGATVTSVAQALGFGLNTNSASNAVIRLEADAADTLAQRRTTNAQTFRIYNSYTDGSNFERGKLQWDSNVLKIGTEKAGTGSARALELQTDGTTRLTISTTDNFTFGSTFVNKAFSFPSVGYLYGRATGVFQLSNATDNGFDRLQFGGTTSSFPALKRDSTTLKVRLADDSANAPLESASLKTDAPAGGTAATWKLGTVASVTPTSPNRTIEVDIGGTIYYISAKTTND